MDQQLVMAFHISSDGCTYMSEYLLGVFDNLPLAMQVCEKSMKTERDQNVYTFEWKDTSLYVMLNGKIQDGDECRIEFVKINEER